MYSAAFCDIRDKVNKLTTNPIYSNQYDFRVLGRITFFCCYLYDIPKLFLNIIRQAMEIINYIIARTTSVRNFRNFRYISSLSRG